MDKEILGQEEVIRGLTEKESGELIRISEA
jgi:hypothetical protein